MKIDVSAHFRTQKFIDAFSKLAGISSKATEIGPGSTYDPSMSSVEKRLEILDKFPGYTQVLTPSIRTLETHAIPEQAAYLASIANDEFAELVQKYPDKFVAGISLLPLNNMKAAMKELERAVDDLGLKGVQIPPSVIGKPMDSPEFIPIYERMAAYNLPVWIHPARLSSTPDYATERESKYNLYLAFGWPYESSLCLGRLICSGLLDRYPNLKIVSHHGGAMIPFFSGRLAQLRMKDTTEKPFSQKPVEYFKKIYADTAIYGNTPGLMCTHSFFGTDKMLFGTDMPYGPGFGEYFIKQTIEAVDKMNIPEADKNKIYEGNARELLCLSI